MDAKSVEPPEAFARLVRDALLHLYDATYMQTHPLAVYIDPVTSGGATSGKLLCQALLDGIGALHPDPHTLATSVGMRSYRILELRYIAGHDVQAVMDEVALSRRQYHREHQRALQAVTALLWERWHLDRRWREPAGNDLSAKDGEFALARMEAERLGSDPGDEPTDAAEALESVGSLLRGAYPDKCMDISICTSREGCMVRGDRVALRHALLAVLTHLVRDSGTDPVKVTVANTDGTVEIRIVANVARSTDELLTGVGESRSFVEALRGTLSCRQSGADPGTIDVTLRYPHSHPPTLMVVDNNEDFIRLVTRYLAGRGWTVVGASDVDSALRLAQERRPRAILLDVVLPGQDGWEFLARRRSLDGIRDIPVIVCSALHESGLADALGATLYLQKPVDQRQLIAALVPYQ